MIVPVTLRGWGFTTSIPAIRHNQDERLTVLDRFEKVSIMRFCGRDAGGSSAELEPSVHFSPDVIRALETYLMQDRPQLPPWVGVKLIVHMGSKKPYLELRATMDPAWSKMKEPERLKLVVGRGMWGGSPSQAKNAEAPFCKTCFLDLDDTEEKATRLLKERDVLKHIVWNIPGRFVASNLVHDKGTAIHLLQEIMERPDLNSAPVDGEPQSLLELLPLLGNNEGLRVSTLTSMPQSLLAVEMPKPPKGDKKEDNP